VANHELAGAAAVHVKLDPGQAAGGRRQKRGDGVLPEAAAVSGAEPAMADDRRLAVEDHDRSLVEP
jgi:hypothetical protein